MSTKKPASTPAASLVGSALGSIAKRVGALVTEVSQVVSLPDEVRKTLDEARKHRQNGNFAEALAVLNQISDNHRNDANIGLSRWLTQASAWWWGEESEAHRGDLPEALRHLAQAENLARTGQWEQALEVGRRALRTPVKGPTIEALEATILNRWLVAQAYAHHGAYDRALHEAATIDHLGRELAMPLLWTRLRDHAIKWSLAAGYPERAESWLQLGDQRIEAATLLGATLPADQAPRLLLHRAALAIRVALALGRYAQAKSQAQALPEGPLRQEALVRCDLASGHIDPLTRQRAAEVRGQQDLLPAGPRLWALTELAATLQGQAPTASAAVLEIFEQGAQRSRGKLAQAWWHERAFAALAVDRLHERERGEQALPKWHHEVKGAVEVEVAKRSAAALPANDHESAVDHAHQATQATEIETITHDIARFTGQLASEAALDLALGVDELSPLRQGAWRKTVVLAHLHRQAAGAAAEAGDRERALDEHAKALTYLPSLRASVDAIDRAFAVQDDPEDHGWLQHALRVLERMEAGESEENAAELRETQRHIRSELDRPRRALTVAVVGEFSAGKSSLVNAMLGQALSPVGVLPTTKTILRFRRGNQATRMVDSAGKVRLIEANDTTRYLHSLTPDEAREVATIECFGAWPNLGDVVLIDTPGLNAGDEGHEEATRALVDEIDALVWVFSATRAGAASEVGAIRQWLAQGHAVLAVLNKTDALDASEVQALVAYLQEALPQVVIVPTSTAGNREVPGRSGDSVRELFAAWQREFVARKSAIQSRVATQRAVVALRAALERLEHQRRARHATRDGAATFVGDSDITTAWDQRLRDVIVDLDDTLMREVLALGLAPSTTNRHDDDDDWQGLVARLGNELFLHLARLGADFGGHAVDTPLRLAWQDFLAWSRGAWAGVQHQASLAQQVRRAAQRSEGGEQGLKSVFREVLRELAELWVGEWHTTLRRYQPRRSEISQDAPRDKMRDFWHHRLAALLATPAALSSAVAKQ